MIGIKPRLARTSCPVLARRIVATIDARRGELFYAFYRQVPGGVQRLSDHQIGTPDDLASELLASGEDCLLVGDGALRYAEAFEGLTRWRSRTSGWHSRLRPPLVQLAHAQALRSSGCSRGSATSVPAGARRRDQLVDA